MYVEIYFNDNDEKEDRYVKAIFATNKELFKKMGIKTARLELSSLGKAALWQIHL